MRDDICVMVTSNLLHCEPSFKMFLFCISGKLKRWKIKIIFCFRSRANTKHENKRHILGYMHAVAEEG